MERHRAVKLSKDVVEAVISNLSERKGIGNELEETQPSAYRELIQTLENTVLEVLCQSE